MISPLFTNTGQFWLRSWYREAKLICCRSANIKTESDILKGSRLLYIRPQSATPHHTRSFSNICCSNVDLWANSRFVWKSTRMRKFVWTQDAVRTNDIARTNYIALKFSCVSWCGITKRSLLSDCDSESCKWNQLGAQYSQYISSVLFVTSTCFGSLLLHHQEEWLYLYAIWYFFILYS